MKLFLKSLRQAGLHILGTVQSLLLVILFSRWKSMSVRRAKARTLIILGNGPSLRHSMEDVRQVMSEVAVDVCAVNAFACVTEFSDIRPSRYVLADPNYWREGVSPSLEHSRQALLDAFNQRVDWPMRLFLPVAAKGARALQRLDNSHIETVFYNSTPIGGVVSIRHALFDLGAGMPPPFNVLIAALSIGLHEGYRSIYLLGADHSWHEELRMGGEGVELAQKHFYPETVSHQPVLKEVGAFTTGDLFMRWGQVFKIYEALAVYAASRGVDVVNASSISYIDAFRRANLRALLGAGQ